MSNFASNNATLANQTGTLWQLPAEPLPASNLTGPVVVTIWFAASLLFSLLFNQLLRRRSNPTWPEFRSIITGTLFLAFWYLIVLVDRWIHYDIVSVVFGYIVVQPLWQSFRVISTVIYLWGTWTVVWREFEERFSNTAKRIWWSVSKFTIFVASVMAIYFVTLYFSLAVVWMQFVGLDTINSLAQTTAQFEITMNVLFFAFGLLTVVAATWALLFRAKSSDGRVRKTRIVLWLATLLLLARSGVDFGMTLNIFSTDSTRQTTQTATDIAYGLLTLLYLLATYTMAHITASRFDTGGKDVRGIHSDVRRFLLQRLETQTNGARQPSPVFESLLREAEENKETLLAAGPQAQSSRLSQESQLRAVQDCIDQLRAEFGGLDPKEGRDYGSRGPSAMPSISGMSSLFGGRKTRSPGANKMLGVKGVPSNSDIGSSYTSTTLVQEENASAYGGGGFGKRVVSGASSGYQPSVLSRNTSVASSVPQYTSSPMGPPPVATGVPQYMPSVVRPGPGQHQQQQNNGYGNAQMGRGGAGGASFRSFSQMQHPGIIYSHPEHPQNFR